MNPTIPQLLLRFCGSSPRMASRLGMVGACLYITGLVLPLQWDIPLLVLALLSVVAVITRSQASETLWSPLTLLVMTFLVVTALSILLSVDIGRSLRLSTPLLPSMLLFFLLAEYFDGSKDIRLLYLTLSVVGLMIAFTVLWAAWHAIDAQNLRSFIPRLRVPLLVVPNDLTFLALIAPLSLVLVYREPRGIWSILAALSLLLSMAAICILMSRTAAVTMVISLLCVTLLTQTGRRLVTGLVGIVALVLSALLLNALFFRDTQLLAKFVSEWETDSGRTITGRTQVWSTAWRLFLQAPVFGHGPHTFGVFHTEAPWAHNLYLEVLVEQGFIGLIALSSLLTCALIAAWKLQGVARRDVHLFSAAALAGLVGFCSAAVVELSFVRQWVVIMLFVLLGVIAHFSSSNPER